MSDDDLHIVSGPALLLAGPGTGKTYRLGKRIKYLIEEKKVSPSEVTVITFTSTAARNMRERISDETRPELFLPYSSQPRLICTMHSLGYRILRENAERIGIRDPIKVVTDDKLRLILMGDAAQLAGFSRSSGAEPAICRQSGICNREETPKCAICEKYQQILRACSAVDYDEQILLACRMLREIPELLSKYRAMARHLLVDEYQDINAAQFELIWILSEGQRDGLFVVGDDDQSIYSWRGGSPSYIRDFRRYFGRDAVVAPLSKSYRCHRHILEGAMNIVKTYDSARLPKGDFKYRVEDGPTIKIHNVPSDEKEAKAIKKIIEKSIPAEDVLVLYPQRQYGNELAAQLRASQIQFSAPVNIPGAGMPLTAHIANWLSDPSDNLSFRRLIEAYFQNPKSGIPSSRVRKPDKKEQREGAYGKVASLWYAVVSGRTGSLWESLQTSKATDSLLETIEGVFKNLLEVFAAKADVAEFVSSIARDIAPWKTIDDYLEEVSAWVEYGSQATIMGVDADVRLMTLQAAKGLEAKVVCVVGVEEGTIPKGDEPATISEQSRLLYVSMTRAVNELHLFHARKRSSDVALRNVFKESGPPDIRPSQFLNAIPKEHLERVFHKY